MSCPPQTVCIGPFTEGEIPDPLVYTFLDADGNPIPIAGYAVRLVYAERGTPGAPTTRTGATGAQPGEATYPWVAADLARRGRYRGEFWAGNGTVRRASVRLQWDVHAAVGPAPVI